VEKTAAAIVVLLLFLLVMNALAIYLRMRTQRKW
jgi:phosphate transport system permease protein